MSDQLAFKTVAELARVLRERGDPEIERSGLFAAIVLLAAIAD